KIEVLRIVPHTRAVGEIVRVGAETVIGPLYGRGQVGGFLRQFIGVDQRKTALCRRTEVSARKDQRIIGSCAGDDVIGILPTELDGVIRVRSDQVDCVL